MSVKVSNNKEECRQRLSQASLQNVLWLSQKFEVTPSWIHNEMAKGYLLIDVYEGLLIRQQGGSYERFMQYGYENAFEAKNRNKRNAIIRKVAEKALELGCVFKV